MNFCPAGDDDAIDGLRSSAGGWHTFPRKHDCWTWVAEAGRMRGIFGNEVIG